LEDIEAKTIRLDYLSGKSGEYEETINEFCYFFIDVYYSATLMFVIVDPGRDGVTHAIECDENLSILLDLATENARSKRTFGKFPIDYGIEGYLKHKLESRNKIVYKKEEIEKTYIISSSFLKGCLLWIAFYIAASFIIFLFYLLFKY